MKNMPKKRTIDERLDALTMNVELLVALHNDNEKRMAKVLRDLSNEVEKTARIVDTLAHVALSHNGRILKLERKRK